MNRIELDKIQFEFEFLWLESELFKNFESWWFKYEYIVIIIDASMSAFYY